MLDYVEVPTPRPKPGEVLVKADTIGVSRPELLVRRGVYPWMPPLPVIPGIEMAGTVAELGAGAAASPSARRSMSPRANCRSAPAATPNTSRCRSARCSRCRPDADLEAAACLSNYQVAWHLLHTATRGAPGQSVLIGSASGGLGSAAVQLAKLAGMTAIALVGTRRRRRARSRRSAPITSSTRAARMSRRGSRSITGGVGVDLILDAVGGKDFAKFLPMLGPFGLLVSYGKLVGKIESNVVDALDAGPGYLNSAAVRIFTMHTLDDKPAHPRRSR